jgi:hypothetical protein
MNAAYAGAYKTYKTFGKWQVFYDAFSKENVTLSQNLRNELTIADATTNVILGATLVIVTVGVGLVLAGIIVGNSAYVKAGLIVLQAAAMMALVTRIMMYVWQISIAVRAGVTTFTGLSNIAALSRSAGLVSGLLMSLAVIWGLFIYQMAFGKIQFGSIEFNFALARAIADTIVALIFLALAFIPIIGPLIVILLSITDLILYWVGVKGLSTLISEQIADALYDVDFLVKNLDNPDRLNFSIEAVQLRDEDKGFSTANAISYTVMVTSVINYKNSFDNDDGRRATFRYFLQTDETPRHDGLQQNDMKNEWIGRPGTSLMTITETTSPMIALSGVGAGVNRTLNGPCCGLLVHLHLACSETPIWFR